MGFRPMFLVQGSWCGNGQVFATKEEAEGSARARFMVWTMPTDCRADECPDAPNYERVDGQDRALPEQKNPADSSQQPQPEKSTMSINEQARTLGTALSTLPSETLVKVCMVFTKLGLRHWGAEVTKHQANAASYPEGSRMRQAADAAYGNAFRNWHRLSILNGSLAGVLSHPTYGSKPEETETKQAA